MTQGPLLHRLAPHKKKSRKIYAPGYFRAKLYKAVPDAQLRLPALSSSLSFSRSAGPSSGWEWGNFEFVAVLLQPGTYYSEVDTEPAGWGSATVQIWTGGVARTTGGAYGSVYGGAFERDQRSDFNYRFNPDSEDGTTKVTKPHEIRSP